MSSTATVSNSSATVRSPRFSALPIGASYSSELPIAFSKIEGLEVTPLTPSVSISRFRSPLAMKPRARKSSQTACPCFSSSLTGFMIFVSLQPTAASRGDGEGLPPPVLTRYGVNMTLRGNQSRLSASYSRHNSVEDHRGPRRQVPLRERRWPEIVRPEFV